METLMNRQLKITLNSEITKLYTVKPIQNTENLTTHQPIYYNIKYRYFPLQCILSLQLLNY